MFPDLADYRVVLVDDRAETRALIVAILSVTGVEVMLAEASASVGQVIRARRPHVVLVATSIASESFRIVDLAHRNEVPVLALDLGSADPEIGGRLRREYGVAVLGTVDDPEAMCRVIKRIADEGRSPRSWADVRSPGTPVARVGTGRSQRPPC